MKLKCVQENLNQGVGIVSNIASKNTNLLILNNILLKAGDGLLSLVATNLEIGVVCNIRAKIEQEGKFTVPASIFSNYINLLSGGNVDVELEGKEVVIKSGKQETKIKGETVDEFPIIPEIDKKNGYECTSEDIIKAFSNVSIAASLDETRPEISGVLLNFNKDKLVVAATDSYRLAEKKLSCKSEEDEEKNVIVPQKTILEVIRICSIYKPERFLMFLSDNQIMFDLGDVMITSRLIEGEYPDYKQIIPNNEKTKIVMNREEFIKVIKTASLFSKSGINDVNLYFSKDNEEVVVSAVNTQLGENKNKISAEISGEDNDIVFNYRYLLDGLVNINSEKIVLKIIDNGNPGVFLPDTEENDYIYIVMPIKQ